MCGSCTYVCLRQPIPQTSLSLFPFLVQVLEGVDPFLQEFERRKEDRVHRGRPSHRHSQAAIHISSEELDLGYGHLLALRVHECVSLVDALHGVDGVCVTKLWLVEMKNGGLI